MVWSVLLDNFRIARASLGTTGKRQRKHVASPLPGGALDKRQDFSMVNRYFQLCALGLGFSQDGDVRVRVGVFPQRKKIVVGAAGLSGIALQFVGAAQLEVC